MAEAEPPDPAADAAAAAADPTIAAAADASSSPAIDPSIVQASAAAAAADVSAATAPAPAGDASAAGAPALDQFSIDELLSQASFEDPGKIQGAQAEEDPAAAAIAAQFKLPSFQ